MEPILAAWTHVFAWGILLVLASMRFWNSPMNCLLLGHGRFLRRLAASLFAAAAIAHPSYFVLLLGEGHGWSSTSVPTDDAVAESKNAFVRTPNLERLAAGGMRFANFYARQSHSRILLALSGPLC